LVIERYVVYLEVERRIHFLSWRWILFNLVLEVDEFFTWRWRGIHF